jgi:hypothetical protein
MSSELLEVSEKVRPEGDRGSLGCGLTFHHEELGAGQLEAQSWAEHGQ